MTQIRSSARVPGGFRWRIGRPTLVAILAAASFLFAGAGEVWAVSYSMEELLAGQTIVFGRKEFYNFRLFNSVDSGGADAPDASEVFVFTDPASEWSLDPGEGLIIQSGKWNVDPGGTIDTTFTYNVRMLPEWLQAGYRIKDVSMLLMSYDAHDGGEIHITESVTTVDNTPLANLLVEWPNGPILERVDFAPVSEVIVRKDISLEGHATGRAALSTLGQYFSQVVPEPSSVVLMGVGGLGLGLFTRRRLSRATA